MGKELNINSYILILFRKLTTNKMSQKIIVLSLVNFCALKPLWQETNHS